MLNQSELSIPPRCVERVRHELRRREVQVARVERLSPNFIAVTLTGPELEGFLSLSFDDHLKFIFPDGHGEMVRRDYTPRHFDAARQELTLEFALHEAGLATDWARQAAPGQRVTIGGPRGSLIIPTDYYWHLLAGDATALPAIHRRLEELPAGVRAFVIAQVDDAADQRVFASRADVTVQWVTDGDALFQAVRAFALPAGEGFVWCAGEAAEMARLRQVLLMDKGHPKESARVAAYWKRGASEFHENLA